MDEITTTQRATELLKALASQLDRAKSVQENKTRSGVELRMSGHLADVPITVSMAQPWKKLVVMGTCHDAKF